MNLILDYPDMIRSGMIKIGELRNEDCDKFAVIIKTAKNSIGKFPISTPEQIRESIYAIENNPHIPDNILTSAKYFIKQAAVTHNIDVKWDSTPADSEIDVSEDWSPKVAVHVPTIKLGDRTYPMDNRDSVADAEEAFLLKEADIDTKDRFVIGEAIVKTGALYGHKASDITRAYASHKIGNRVDREFLIRKSAVFDNEEYHENIDKLSQIRNKVEPAEFIQCVQLMDKEAGFCPQKFNHSYADFFMNDSPRHKVDFELADRLIKTGGDKLIANII